MKNPKVGIALEWWLREQDKFEGAKVCTKASLLTKWEVVGIAEPTDKQIEQIVTDYEAQLKIKQEAEVSTLASVKTKLKNLGFTDEEIGLLL